MDSLHLRSEAILWCNIFSFLSVNFDPTLYFLCRFSTGYERACNKYNTLNHTCKEKSAAGFCIKPSSSQSKTNQNRLGIGILDEKEKRNKGKRLRILLGFGRSKRRGGGLLALRWRAWAQGLGLARSNGWPGPWPGWPAVSFLFFLNSFARRKTQKRKSKRAPKILK